MKNEKICVSKTLVLLLGVSLLLLGVVLFSNYVNEQTLSTSSRAAAAKKTLQSTTSSIAGTNGSTSASQFVTSARNAASNSSSTPSSRAAAAKASSAASNSSPTTETSSTSTATAPPAADSGHEERSRANCIIIGSAYTNRPGVTISVLVDGNSVKQKLNPNGFELEVRGDKNYKVELVGYSGNTYSTMCNNSETCRALPITKDSPAYQSGRSRKNVFCPAGETVRIWFEGANL